MRRHHGPHHHGHFDDPTGPIPTYTRFESRIPADEQPTLQMAPVHIPRHARPAGRFSDRVRELIDRIRIESAVWFWGMAIGAFFGGAIGLQIGSVW
ncbi:hypothetical protein [Nocardia sp. NPDC004711]